MSFGEELRRERELRKITLREIARATKIDIRRLEALESNDFEVLPEGLYRRGFIRAYCQHIGVDAESMVDAYLLEERTRSAVAEGASSKGDVMRGNGMYRAQDEENEVEVRMQAELLRRSGRRMLWSVLAVVALLALLGLAGYRWLWPMFQPSEGVPPATSISIDEGVSRE